MFTNLGTPSLYGIGLAYIKEHTDRDKQPMYSLCFKQIFPSGQIGFYIFLLWLQRMLQNPIMPLLKVAIHST